MDDFKVALAELKAASDSGRSKKATAHPEASHRRAAVWTSALPPASKKPGHRFRGLH
jgi:hypothetical protein